MSPKTEELLKVQHKKEIKTFESNQRIALKKVKGTAGKGKKGKEILALALEEWTQKYNDMNQKHDIELVSLLQNKERGEENKVEGRVEEDNNVTIELIESKDVLEKKKPSSTPTIVTPQQQLSAKEKALNKKLKKKKKLLEKQKLQEKEYLANKALDEAGPNPRIIENDRIYELYLQEHNMKIDEVLADGNCLYRAVAHQLFFIENRNRNKCEHEQQHEQEQEQKVISFQDIRSICAQSLISNQNIYEPFANLDDYNVSTFQEYIEKVRNSCEWGGHLELRALATALKKNIIVYSADSHPLHIQASAGAGNGNGGLNDHDGSGEEVDGYDDYDNDSSIRLSFHKYYYALGEHYNSVITSI